MVARICFVFLAALSVVASAHPFMEEPNPSWAQMVQAWPFRAEPDAADMLLRSLKVEPPEPSAELTREVVALLPANPEALRQYILVLMLERQGDRDPCSQPVLDKILSENRFAYPKQALIDAALLTSSDGHFLALALQSPGELFLDPVTQKRVMSDARWDETPALFETCIEGKSAPRDFVDANNRLDNEAIDDLEYRNQCLWALGQFPTPQTVKRIGGVIARHRELLGPDATRSLRTILEAAVASGSLSVVEATDSVLLDALSSDESNSILRINSVIALTVPGNISAVKPLEAQLAVETDPEVAKFLRQCLGIIDPPQPGLPSFPTKSPRRLSAPRQ